MALIFLLFAVLLSTALGHPQCLDFEAPYSPKEPLQLCTEYQEFGCCTADTEQHVISQYNSLVDDLTRSGKQNCINYAKEVLCTRCSPYAAHIYNAESTQVEQPFPGLCREYCESLYDDCGEVLHLFTDSQVVAQAARAGKNTFCQLASTPDIDYCYPDLLTNVELSGNVQPDVTSTSECFCLRKVVDTLRNPILLINAGDGTGRRFVGEQAGKVHVLLPNDTIIGTPFLDIENVVHTSTRRGDERGFLGMTFHPNYSQNGRMFVFYSVRVDGRHYGRVSELRVSETNPNRVDHNSERVIIEVYQVYNNHNGGMIFFDAAGYLMISYGDGGGGGDPLRSGQNTTTLLGKILRLDVDGAKAPGKEYGIPADNPFVGRSDFLPEIYAWGLRNVWRCGIDPGQKETGAGAGRVICGDVGQNAYEELDLLQSGGNYGWNSREGFECYNADCGKIGPEVLPIHAYPHSVGKSITGGNFYRGCTSPNLDGLYIYGDFVVGALWSIHQAPNGTWVNKDFKACDSSLCTGSLINTYDRNILSFGQDEEGEVYMLATSFASTSADVGSVYQIIDPTRRGSPEECSELNSPTTSQATTQSASQTISYGNPPEPVQPIAAPVQGPYMYADNSQGHPLPDAQLYAFEFYANFVNVDVVLIVFASERPPTDFNIRYAVNYRPTSIGKHTVTITGRSVSNDRFGFYVPSGRVPFPHRTDSSFYSSQQFGSQDVTVGAKVSLPNLAGKYFPFRVLVTTGGAAPTPPLPTPSSTARPPTTSLTTAPAFNPTPSQLTSYGNSPSRINNPGAAISGPYIYSDNSAGSPLPQGTVRIVEYYLQSTTSYSGFYFIAYNAISPPRDFTIGSFASATGSNGLYQLNVAWPVGNNDRMGFYLDSGTLPMAHRDDSSYYCTEGFDFLSPRSGLPVKLNQLGGKVFPFRFQVSSGTIAPPTPPPATSSTTRSTSSTTRTTSSTRKTTSSTASPSNCPVICPPGPPGPPCSSGRKRRENVYTMQKESGESELRIKEDIDLLTEQIESLQYWLVGLTLFAISTTSLLVLGWKRVSSV